MEGSYCLSHFQPSAYQQGRFSAAEAVLPCCSVLWGRGELPRQGPRQCDLQQRLFRFQPRGLKFPLNLPFWLCHQCGVFSTLLLLLLLYPTEKFTHLRIDARTSSRVHGGFLKNICGLNNQNLQTSLAYSLYRPNSNFNKLVTLVSAKGLPCDQRHVRAGVLGSGGGGGSQVR